MSRIRSIKPEFWNDEKLTRLSRDSRLTFIGMWTQSDDYGVVKGHPLWLKNQIFPYDNIDLEVFQKWLEELESGKFIIPFVTNEEKYYFIRNFSKHQRVEHPSKTQNPQPPKNITKEYCKDLAKPIQKSQETLKKSSRGSHETLTQEKEREREKEKDKEKESESTRAHEGKNSSLRDIPNSSLSEIQLKNFFQERQIQILDKTITDILDFRDKTFPVGEQIERFVEYPQNKKKLGNPIELHSAMIAWLGNAKRYDDSHRNQVGDGDRSVNDAEFGKGQFSQAAKKLSGKSSNFY